MGPRSQLKWSKCDCQSGSWMVGQEGFLNRACCCFCCNAGFYLFTLCPFPWIHKLMLAREVFAVSVVSQVILVHSRTRQLSIHTGHSYFGKGINRKGLSTSLHNENELAREIYSSTNELSTLCWNFTVFIIPSLLPVQWQFLLHSCACYSVIQ